MYYYLQVINTVSFFNYLQHKLLFYYTMNDNSNKDIYHSSLSDECVTDNNHTVNTFK